VKTASIHELKQELSGLGAPQLEALCLRLAKFKKENKELLTYLLFEGHDQAGYIQSVKQLMDEQFAVVNASSLFLAKKTIRKVLRTANKYVRFSGSKLVEVELLLHFCRILQESGIPFQKSPALANLNKNQVGKVRMALGTLHEDLQYEYAKELAALLDG